MEPVIKSNLNNLKMSNLNNVQKFLIERDISFNSVSQIVNGRNSKVYIVDNNNEKLIVKYYYYDPNDGRDRAKAEYEFLNYLLINNISFVAKPIYYDPHKHINIISFLPGDTPIKISNEMILSCSDFIKKINFNRFNKYSRMLSDASESSDSIFAHISNIGKRIESLTHFSNESIEFDYLNNFVQTKMLKCYQALLEKVLNDYEDEYIKSRLSTNSKILSPSDFGFRNTLIYEGDLYFLDFEYAGWDDPAKIICDFGCQPDIPINDNELNIFRKSFSDWYDLYDDLTKRCNLLLPFYRLKWCCIMLNEFTIKGKKRRDHSKTNINYKKQFTKCANYFMEHLDGLY